MKTMNVVATIAAVAVLALVPAASNATPPPDTNLLGMYTEASNLGVSYTDAALAESVHFYVCLTGCSFGASGIAGYEFQIVQNGASVAVQAYYTMGSTLNIGVPPEFICGLAYPLVPNGDGFIVIMEVIGLSFGGLDSFSFAPIDEYQTIPDEMVIVNALDPSDKQITTATTGVGVFEGISFAINMGPVVPVAESTWGEIRNLYR